MFDISEALPESSADCAAALRASVVWQRRVGAQRLALAASWADMHAPTRPGRADPAWTPYEKRGRAVRCQVGADGTPEVSEFAAVELGVHLEMSTRSAELLLGDALDLRHRLPRVWNAVMTAQIEDWKARKIARATRVLTRQQAQEIDADLLEALEGLPFGRAMTVAEGEVVAADPTGHEKRRASEAHERVVTIGRRSNGSGLRTLFARTTNGDVARLDAMIEHVAHLLALGGNNDTAGGRRARALGVLADPARACLLLARAHDDSAAPGADASPSGSAEPEWLAGSDGTVQPSPVELGIGFGLALHALGPHALDRLRPTAVLYVHVAEEALRGVPGTQVARAEDHGPLGVLTCPGRSPPAWSGPRRTCCGTSGRCSGSGDQSSGSDCSPSRGSSTLIARRATTGWCSSSRSSPRGCCWR